AGSPLRPFAGPFKVVKVTGRARSADADARSTYTFRRNWILGELTAPEIRKRPRSAEVLFPSTGGTSAAVWAVLQDGTVVPVTAARPVQGVRGFWVQSAHSGYAVVPAD